LNQKQSQRVACFLPKTRAELPYLLYFLVEIAVFPAVNIPTGTLSFAFKAAATPLNQDTLFPLTYSLAIFSFPLSLYWFRHEGILALPYAIGIPFL
jgi:hypothetical protein